jgi:iron complex transport system substrate-binding protein
MAPRFTRLRLALLAGLLLVSACAAPSTSTSLGGTIGATPATSSSPSAPPSGTTFPLTLIDDAGRELTLAAAPERIVSLAPSNTEIVCALGACDRLVGVTDFDDYPAEVAEVPDVVLLAQVDLERVVAAEPDLVLAAGNEITPSSVIEQLDGLGLNVLVLYPESLDEVMSDIGLVGQALDAGDAADSIVADMRDRIDAVVALVEGGDRPRTLYEVFYAEGSIYTAGDGSFLASLIDLAGGEPVTGDAQGVLSAEELVEADPQLILLGTASYDAAIAEPAAALDAVRARPGWAELAAVADGRVVPFQDDIVTTRPGPRIVDGLEALAHAIHPDRVP